MATITATTDRNTSNGAIIVTWAAMGNADTGTSFAVPSAANLTFQQSGTFGGATIVLQGSNDGTNWSTLTQTGGANVAFSYTTAGVHCPVEMPVYVRPVTSGGTGSAVDAVLVCRAVYQKMGY
jgi:hypothetical protein